MQTDATIPASARAPVYAALLDHIRGRINDRELKPGDMLESEYELARRVGISRMSVRKAITQLVVDGQIERRPGKGLFVREPNSVNRTIQMVAGNLAWEPCILVSRGGQQVAKTLGVQIQLYDAHGDAELDLEVLRNLPRGNAVGAVIIALHSPQFNEAVFELKLKKYPFVLVDQRLHDIEASSVTADNQGGGYLAGQLLAKHGHQRIAFVGDLAADTVRDRLAGLRDAVGDAGLPFDRSLIVDLCSHHDRLGDWSAQVDSAVTDLMSRPNPPTGIFFSCDAVARTGYRTLAKLGLSIPTDVSVVGFDGDPLSEWLSPPLTTVRQPFMEMGKEAIDLLCKQMADPSARAEARVLPVELIERGSVAACKSKP